VGNYLQGWGGPGDDDEWPADEHTIHFDFKGNVWISSAGGPRLPTAIMLVPHQQWRLRGVGLRVP
jgi:hypothetical protein